MPVVDLLIVQQFLRRGVARATRVYRLLRCGEKQAKKGWWWWLGHRQRKTKTIAAEYGPTGMLVDPKFLIFFPPPKIKLNVNLFTPTICG